MTDTQKIYRILPSNSKKILDRFDAKLRNKEILRVETRYLDDGSIERVDIFYIEKDSLD